MEQTSIPSWLYPITKGATTIWEQWDGINEDNIVRESLNHYSPGAVVSWFFQYTAGINLNKEEAGYQSFIIAPKPGGSLTKAKGVYNSLNGRIVSQWEKGKDGITLNVEIPPNTTAKLILPCKDINKVTITKGCSSMDELYMEQSQICVQLASGCHEFIC